MMVIKEYAKWVTHTTIAYLLLTGAKLHIDSSSPKPTNSPGCILHYTVWNIPLITLEQLFWSWALLYLIAKLTFTKRFRLFSSLSQKLPLLCYPIWWSNHSTAGVQEFSSVPVQSWINPWQMIGLCFHT